MARNADCVGCSRTGPEGRGLKGNIVDKRFGEARRVKGLAEQAVGLPERDTAACGIVSVQDDWRHRLPNLGFSNVEGKNLSFIAERSQDCTVRAAFVGQNPASELDTQKIERFGVCV